MTLDTTSTYCKWKGANFNGRTDPTAFLPSVWLRLPYASQLAAPLWEGYTTASVLHNLSWPLTPSSAQLPIRPCHPHLSGLYQVCSLGVVLIQTLTIQPRNPPSGQLGALHFHTSLLNMTLFPQRPRPCTIQAIFWSPEMCFTYYTEGSFGIDMPMS